MNEQNATVWYVEWEEDELLLENLAKISMINLLDMLSTLWYLWIDSKAVELSPLWGMGLHVFFLLKVLTPMIWYAFMRKVWSSEVNDFASWVFMFYGIAVVINLINILKFLNP